MIENEQPEETSENLNLLFTPEELSNIRVFKLSNGDDVMASIIGHANHLLILKRVCQLVRIPKDNGMTSLILCRWQVFSNVEEQIVNMSAVISYSVPNPGLIEFYIQSIKQQILEEQKEIGYKWPEYLDQILLSGDKSKIN